ncbi:hypothetical protein K488DRAFT_82245 [Vararia minispora EC-137]|uniref:Uncharacterized protein n=1 Tax=Vararia minispora EC-137 TaxID=1314806 RepID=A0ACB8QXN8_9AGAM|nr:hypothetical protein K488DRAFT_82245 [Vararia minispora EC-137]
MEYDMDITSSRAPDLDTGITDDLVAQTRAYDQWIALAHILMPQRSPDTPPHEYRARILSEMHSIDCVLRRARELLNDSREATLALPIELLVEIFCHARDAGENVFNITAVCRRWRAVALGSPRLWTHLNTASLSPRLFDLALSRAGIMPLHVSVDAFTAAPRLSLFAHAHAHRIAFLRIDAREQTCNTFHAPFFEQPLLALRELDINIRLRRAQWDPHEGWFRLLDAPDAPELTSLRLCGTPFAWDAPLYDDLKHLTLFRIERAFVPNAADINALFARMRRLETLELDYVDVRVSPKVAITPPQALRELIVHNASSIDFVASVVRRDGMRWDVSINGPIDPPAAVAFLRRNTPPVVRVVALALQPAAQSCVPGMYVADLQLRTDDTIAWSPPCLRLTLRTASPTLLLDGVRLEQVLTATLIIASPVHSAPSAPSADWGALLQRLSHLRNLILHGFALAHIVPSLRTEEGLLPDLRKITVEAGQEHEHELRDAREAFVGWLWWHERTYGSVTEVCVPGFLADDRRGGLDLERIALFKLALDALL